MPEEKKVLVVKKRFEFGKKRSVVTIGDAITLPLDEKSDLKGGDVKRMIARGAAVVMPESEYKKSIEETK